MPPALSDEESSSDDQIPAQKKTIHLAAQAATDDAEDNDDCEDGENEYVVEKILGHKIVKGEFVFDVKWQGYDDPKDRTWEPESNMGGALDVMHEYFEEIGGRPEAKGQKRKARTSTIKSVSGTPASSAKRAKQEKEWSPPPGSWEHDVSHVDAIEEIMNPRTAQMEKFAYLVWNNQKKTQHPLKTVYQKCPQKMLIYYESHLVFTQNDPLNGDEGITNFDIAND